MGAARAAPAVSSEMCAAESSGDKVRILVLAWRKDGISANSQPVKVHMGAVNARRNAHAPKRGLRVGSRWTMEYVLTVPPTGVILVHGERGAGGNPLIPAAYQ